LQHRRHLHAHRVGAGNEPAAGRAGRLGQRRHEDDHRLMTRRLSAAVSRDGGFTLVEIVISMAVIGVIFAMYSVTMSSTIRGSSRIQENSVLQGEVRANVDAIARDLRQASTGNGTPAIETMTASQIQFVSPDSATPMHLRRIAYRVNGANLERASASS